jgi:lipopolysaccharide/colanic/teichoic acid biosynthesis glycosyltransferase
MRLASPASRMRLRLRLVGLDVVWAALSPFAALALRDPGLLDAGDFPTHIPETYQYAFLTILCTLASILLFRLGDGLSRFFSLHDALVICAATACAVASSSAIGFTLTRLDGVPRSTPLILGLVLGSGLILARAAVPLIYKEFSAEPAHPGARSPSVAQRHVILVGINRFAAAAIRLIDTQKPRTTQVVAALDSRPATVGRKIAGVSIVGQVQDLEAIVDEYVVHGVVVDEVWLTDDTRLPPDTFDWLAHQCRARNLELKTVSEALNLNAPPARASDAVRSEAHEILESNGYLAYKRVLDVAAATVLALALAPLAACMVCLTAYDVGTPTLFWQQRIGRGGRKFLLYKFRSYRAPFDGKGRRIPNEQRLTRIGRAIRASRLDEIPQLYNVLIGDMSLIGPRPLLPQDQPSDPSLRLVARPGVSGWAQINGGTLISPEEKNALDLWYIRHASLLLDLKIAFLTIRAALTGENVNKHAVAQALDWRRQFFDRVGRPESADDRYEDRAAAE